MTVNPKEAFTTEVKQGLKSQNNADLPIDFPNPEYFGSTNVNYAAVGADRTTLWTGGTVGDKVPQGTSSIYPLNQVSESRSGHRTEVDDTPGNQRMIFRHANQKTGIELGPEGNIVITTPKGRVEVIGEDHDVIVEGNGKLIYKGNLELQVTGDINMECHNYNLTVHGNKTERVKGASRTQVKGNMGTEVSGAMSTTVGGFVVNTFLKGMQNNIKGTFTNAVNGIANFFASGTTNVTSEGNMFIAADNMNQTANNMTVMGGAGTIGGASVLFAGKGATFGEGVTAPTFHGSLEGNAKTATEAGKAGTAGSLGASGSAGSHTNTATPTITSISTSEVASLIEPDNNSVVGARQVKVDVGDFIRDQLNSSKANGGVTSEKPTTAIARDRFRNPNNRTNSDFVANAIGQGAICISFNEKIPVGIGRKSNYDTPKASSGEINPAYIPSKRTEVFTTVPDEYNPENVYAVSAMMPPSTLLAPGIPLSKFLSTGETSVNMDAVTTDKEARVRLARYYYLHAQIIKTIQNDDGPFRDYRLEVAEGLYKKEPGETIEKDSIADLRRQGRAVVYNLVNDRGEPAVDKMYDLADFWKDTIAYEKLILDYDTIDCKVPLSARIIVIMPELEDRSWTANYKRILETHFNGSKLAEAELVEALSFNPDAIFLDVDEYSKLAGEDPYPHHRMNQTLNTADVGYDNVSNGKLNPSTLIKIANAGPNTFGSGPLLLSREYAARWFDMLEAAKQDGITLIPSSAYRSYTYQELAYKEHKAVNPNYPIAKPGRSNHGLGEAIDIKNSRGPGDPVWEWLKANGGRFGFLQSDRLKYKDSPHWSRTGS